MNIKTILQLHIYLWFPACKPFYIIFLFKLLWEKLHQISQTLNNVWINGWNTTLKMEKPLHGLVTLGMMSAPADVDILSVSRSA